MDDPFPLPDSLRTRPPGPNDPNERRERVHDFDLALQSAPDCPSFSGVHVFRDFFDVRESETLLREIESTPFAPAQSGKLKQHFGARVNFNKQKINLAGFDGLPDYVRRLEARLRERILEQRVDHDPAGDTLSQALDCYESTDVFVLRYHARNASNLDLHRDDCFAYGETILDLSLESDSVLTFVHAPIRDETGAPPGRMRESLHEATRDAEWAEADCVRVPLPARSLAVLHGPARFDWEHGILAYDIEGRRTSITLRTQSDTLRETELGQELLDIVRGSNANA